MNKFIFSGNGKNKDFYFTFPFFSKADIIVKVNNNLATGYGVFCIPGSGNNDFPFTGGHIHFAVAPKSTDVVTIERKLQLNRLIDYQPTAPLNPTTVNQDMNYFFELLKDVKSELLGFAETYKEFTDTESAQELLARIDAVIEEIDDLGDISTITSSISELGSSITSLTNSLNSLTSTVGTHTTDIVALSTFKDGVLDYVIESQEPTAENNYTWYRKYKSGWVEQGGVYRINLARQDVSATISFPVAFSNIDYVAMCCPTSFEYSNNNTGFIFTQSKTTSDCIFHVFTNNAGSVCDGFDWHAYGC